MGEAITAVLELVVVALYVLGRLAATVAICWVLMRSEISQGWKVFLLILAILMGLGFSLRYHNPYDRPAGYEQPAQETELKADDKR